MTPVLLSNLRSSSVNRSAVVMLLLMAVMAFTGCSKPKDSADALLDPLSPTAYPQIAALDGLGRFISFSSPSITTNASNELNLAVPVRLVHGLERGIEYKFEFFNRDGSPRVNHDQWQYMKLQPGVQRLIAGHAKDAGPRDWRLLLRPAPTN